MMELPGGGQPAGVTKNVFPTPIFVVGAEWFYSELVVFEWEISLEHTTLEQELIENEVKVQPQNFEDRIVNGQPRSLCLQFIVCCG